MSSSLELLMLTADAHRARVRTVFGNRSARRRAPSPLPPRLADDAPRRPPSHSPLSRCDTQTLSIEHAGTVSNWSQGSRRHEPSQSAPTRHASTSATTVAEPHMLRNLLLQTYSPMSPSLDTHPTSPVVIRHRPLFHPPLPVGHPRTYASHPYLRYQIPR